MTRPVLDQVLNDPRVQEHHDKIKRYHVDTYEHMVRTADLCVNMAERDGLSESARIELGFAGGLHDIGKLWISQEILDKPDKLTDYERWKIDWHSSAALYHLRNFKGDRVRKIVMNHHDYTRVRTRLGEFLNGQLRKRRPSEIDRAIQILTVADIYDALSHTRSYRPAMPIDKVEEILRTQFKGDQKLVDNILGLYGKPYQ